MNIIAALLTHYLIAQNNQQIHVLETQVNDIEQLINNYWQENQAIERKKEFILILLQINPHPSARPAVYQYVFDYLVSLNATYQMEAEQSITIWQQQDTINVAELVNLLETARSLITEEIDDVYLKQINTVRQIEPLRRANASLTSIALFLQLMGLIFVLSRDWQWRVSRR